VQKGRGFWEWRDEEVGFEEEESKRSIFLRMKTRDIGAEFACDGIRFVLGGVGGTYFLRV